MKHARRILCSNFYPQENVLGLSEARPIDSTTVFTPQPYVNSMEFRNDNDIYSSQVIPMVFSSNGRVNLTVPSKPNSYVIVNHCNG